MTDFDQFMKLAEKHFDEQKKNEKCCRNCGWFASHGEWKIGEFALMKPLLCLRMEQAQVLMDDLWNAGVRPTEGAGSAGAMRAAQAHIADLRRVTFKVLGIDEAIK